MQKHTSKNTSINSTKLPRIYSLVSDKIEGRKAIDYGCGKYFDNYGLKGVTGYDPYNYKDDSALERVYDVALCSNVLNVIDDKGARLETLRTLKSLAPVVYITVYEGDRSGKSRETKDDCFQLNWSRGNYIPELVEIFGKNNVKWNRKGFYECTR